MISRKLTDNLHSLRPSKPTGQVNLLPPLTSSTLRASCTPYGSQNRLAEHLHAAFTLSGCPSEYLQATRTLCFNETRPTSLYTCHLHALWHSKPTVRISTSLLLLTSVKTDLQSISTPSRFVAVKTDSSILRASTGTTHALLQSKLTLMTSKRLFYTMRHSKPTSRTHLRPAYTLSSSQNQLYKPVQAPYTFCSSQSDSPNLYSSPTPIALRASTGPLQRFAAVKVDSPSPYYYPTPFSAVKTDSSNI